MRCGAIIWLLGLYGIACGYGVAEAEVFDESRTEVRCTGAVVSKEQLLRASVDDRARTFLVFINAGGPCFIGDTINIASNTVIKGINNPTLALRSEKATTLFRLRDAQGVQIRDLTIDGGVYDQLIPETVKPVIHLIGASSTLLSNLVVTAAPRDIRLDIGSHDNTIEDVRVVSPGYYRTPAGEASTYNGLTLVDAFDNRITNFSSIGQAGWTIGIVGSSRRNRIVNANSSDSGIELIGVQSHASENEIVSPKIHLNAYPKWRPRMSIAKGERVISGQESDGVYRSSIYIADTAGVTGEIPPNCKTPRRNPHPTTPLSKCHDGGVTWAYWRDNTSASDNCISLSGSKNVIDGGMLEACRQNGVGIYGDGNIVKNVTISDAGVAASFNGLRYFGVDIESGYGGVAQNNAVINNIVRDGSHHAIEGAVHVGGAYPAWNAGLSPTNELGTPLYAVYDKELYRAVAKSAVTTDFPPPSCKRGRCADGGGVEWEHMRHLPGDTRAIDNDINGNVLK